MASLPHTTTKDFEVDEYVIPEGATVFLNIRGIMHNPKVSKDNKYSYMMSSFLSTM